MTFLNVTQVNPLTWNDSKLISHDSPSSRYNRTNILKNYENFNGIFEIVVDIGKGELNSELYTNIGITNSFITAVECLGASLYAPSILFASITVEIIINHDERLDQIRTHKKRKWLDLNTKNLKIAFDKGLPTDVLLESGEQFSDKTIKFTAKRNKIAHGDTEGYRNTRQVGSIFSAYSSGSHSPGSHTTLYWQPEKEDAIDHIRKVHKFVEAWGKTNPKLRLH